MESALHSFDNLYTDDELVIIEYHVNWPNTQDPYYLHNPVDINGRRNFYGVNSVPKTKLDGYYQPTSLSTMINYYEYEVGLGSPANIALYGDYDSDANTGNWMVRVTTEEELDENIYKVFVALTEDPTGSDYDTMRKMLPNYNGTVVDLSGPAPRTAIVSGTFATDDIYVESNCRLVAWVQPVNHPTKVLNATCDYIEELQTATDVAAAPVRFKLGRNFPNPFNPSTTIPVTVKESGIALVEVLSADGRRVRVLHEGLLDAGTHELVWDGRDHAGHPMASGIYMARLIGATERLTERMVMLK